MSLFDFLGRPTGSYKGEVGVFRHGRSTMLDLLERAHALMGSVGVSPPRLRRPPSIPPSPPAASNEPPAFASSASGSGASFEEPSTTQLLDSLPPEVCLAVREALLSLPAQAAQADDALEHIIGCLSEHRKRRESWRSATFTFVGTMKT